MMIEIVATVAGLLGISAIQLLKQYRSFKKRLDEKDAESELLEHATGYRRILADRLLTQAIDRLYPLASLSAQGLGRIAIVGGDDVRLTTLVARPEWHDIRLLVTPDRAGFPLLIEGVERLAPRNIDLRETPDCSPIARSPISGA